MKKYLIKWAGASFGIFVASNVLSGIHVKNMGTVFFIAAVLGVLNIIVRPILFLITLPITIVTLGLFTFVLNAFLLQLVARLINGFTVDSFSTAFLASLLISLASWALTWPFIGVSGIRYVRFGAYSRGGRRVRDLQ